MLYLSVTRKLKYSIRWRPSLWGADCFCQFWGFAWGYCHYFAKSISFSLLYDVLVVKKLPKIDTLDVLGEPTTTTLGTNLENQSWQPILTINLDNKDMSKIRPEFAKDLPKICPRYARLTAMFKLKQLSSYKARKLISYHLIISSSYHLIS